MFKKLKYHSSLLHFNCNLGEAEKILGKLKMQCFYNWYMKLYENLSKFKPHISYKITLQIIPINVFTFLLTDGCNR